MKTIWTGVLSSATLNLHYYNLNNVDKEIKKASAISAMTNQNQRREMGATLRGHPHYLHFAA
jgi:hypothetical protein